MSLVFLGCMQVMKTEAPVMALQSTWLVFTLVLNYLMEHWSVSIDHMRFGDQPPAYGASVFLSNINALWGAYVCSSQDSRAGIASSFPWMVTKVE